MAIMKFKNSNGEWQGIPAFKGENGKDGAIQYKAGDGIKIENDTITAEVTKDYLDGKLEELAEIGFTPEISESLPTENIDENTIYMIPSQDGEGDNIYEEWMYINNKWEMIGSTSVDLTDYATKTYVDDKTYEPFIFSRMNFIPSNTSNSWSFKTDELTQFYALMTKYKDKLLKEIWFMRTLSESSNGSNPMPYPVVIKFKLTDSYHCEKMSDYEKVKYVAYLQNCTNDSIFITVWFQVNVSYDANGVFNGSIEGNKVTSNTKQYLPIDNSTGYTPTGDYNPATKKYVDDAVAGIDIPESNIVSIDVSAFSQTPFSSGSVTGYASSNESVKAGLEKIARLGAGICIIHLYNRYSSMLCVFSNSYNHSDGGWGAYYTGSYQKEGSGVNGTKAVVTTKYSSNGTPQNIKILFDTDEGFVIKDNVLTKTNTTSYTPSANYHPATKKYVDDAISNIDIPEPSTDAKGFYTYKMNLGNLGFAGEIDEYGYITHIITELCKTETNDLVNKILADGINQPLVVIENTNTEADLKTMLLFGFDTNYDPAVMQNLDFTFHGVANYIGSATGSLMMKYENSVMFSGTGIMTDGVWDATAIGIAITTQQSLTTDNTWEYTPTGDYNPATKKYVDDAVEGVSGGITSESDPIFTGSEAYKITSTDTANWNSKLDSTQVNAAINSVLNSKSYLTSESDPLFSRSEAAKITSTDTANWNSKVDITAVNNAINNTLNNKSYLTSESDPTVPAWAKQPNKPTYTASEVGALPASTVIPTVPTKLSGFTDDLGTSPVHSHSQYLTAHQDISGKQNKVLYGVVDPTSDIGTEGDIYVKYV